MAQTSKRRLRGSEPSQRDEKRQCLATGNSFVDSRRRVKPKMPDTMNALNDFIHLKRNAGQNSAIAINRWGVN